ncbi:E3 ubiquitin-protein ligase APD2-like [Euphorbia lathyris]|uniref:E3 ubiquitin-protein ligase APD2-like n=1 Tax=Euphorbia lathyris TaxID=212925 RepID=UPI00331402FC
MYRSVLPPAPTYPSRRQEPCPRLLASFTLWICVSVSLRYGYYADRHMLLGPSSSRLMDASSLFVQQVQVRDDDKKGVFLYGFSEKPQLTFETNWTASDYLIVAPYSRKGFALWLNKGSRIGMKWETQTSILNQLQMVLIKGERKYETLLPGLTTSPASLNLSKPLNGKEAEYLVEEDDKYYLGLINTNPRSIIIKIALNITSKMHDLSKANNMCSTKEGSCRLMLPFPKTQFVVLTTPDNGDTGGWYIELSFVARVITYIAILGFIIVIILLILRYLGACDSETYIEETTAGSAIARHVLERQPMLPDKPTRSTYGTNEEDDGDGSSSSSSEELYDAKLCVICYDEQRNCFFVPCGHCATCYDCAQRIMDGETKFCPICRRLIHKVRRLFVA